MSLFLFVKFTDTTKKPPFSDASEKGSRMFEDVLFTFHPHHGLIPGHWRLEPKLGCTTAVEYQKWNYEDGEILERKFTTFCKEGIEAFNKGGGGF